LHSLFIFMVTSIEGTDAHKVITGVEFNRAADMQDAHHVPHKI